MLKIIPSWDKFLKQVEFFQQSNWKILQVNISFNAHAPLSPFTRCYFNAISWIQYEDLASKFDKSIRAKFLQAISYHL
jgi:hypothetical protein